MQKVKTGIQYIIAQCVGGVLGAYAAFNLLPSKFACHSLHHNDIACCIRDTVGYTNRLSHLSGWKAPDQYAVYVVFIATWAWQ